MKINLRKFQTIFENTVQEIESVNKVKARFSYEYLSELVDKIDARLSIILPDSAKKGLIFKLTVPVRPANHIQKSTWVTIQHGVKHWFIVGIEVNPGAFTAIHPVNFNTGEGIDTDRLWAMVNKVSSPNWFN